MAAKIIPFPRFMQRHSTLHRPRHAANAPELSVEWDAGDRIHLVGTAKPANSTANAEARRESQQTALRIVQEVQREWNDRHPPTHAVRGERPERFWGTLPVPQPQRETPLTVVRRLMHMFLSDAETA